MKRFFLFLLVVLLPVSCGRVRLCKFMLSDAEKIMTSAPDSALMLIESIEMDGLLTKRLQAKYSLLYSMALDKNYIDVTNDSLINIAVNYYATRGDAEAKMKSYYYLGRVRYNSGNYAGALIAYDNAEKYITNNSNDLFAGLIYRAKADVYNNVYNHHEELKCAQKAYEYFERSGKERYRDFSIHQLGVAQNNNGNYKNAQMLYLHAIDIANAKCDTALLANAILDYASLLSHNNGNAIKVIKLYKRAINELNWQLSVTEYTKLSDAYATLLQKDSSIFYLDIAKQMASNSVDSVMILSTEYRINKLYENYSLALESLEMATQKQDSIFTIMLNESVVASQRDYFKAVSAQIEAKRQAQKQLYVLLVLVLVVIIMAITFCFLQFRSKQKVVMSEFINNANVISRRLYVTTAEKQEMSEKINDLLKDKFTIIDEMLIEYYEKGERSQKYIYDKIRKQMDSLKSDANMLRQLEAILNKYNNGIMNLVRKEIPSLRIDELRFLCYIYLGFSSQALCIFMNESSIDNLYRRKSRLKSKINNSNAPHKDFFVSCFR